MKPICGGVRCHIGTSTGRTVAIAMASNASKNVATPTMIRVLTCHHEGGSRSIRATTLSTARAEADPGWGGPPRGGEPFEPCDDVIDGACRRGTPGHDVLPRLVFSIFSN